MWNEEVRKLGGTVLQSWEWGEFRRRHGWELLRILDQERGIAAQVLLRSLPGLGSFAYVPNGPLFGAASDLEEAAESVASRARESGASLLEIEPRVEENHGFKTNGFVKSKSPVQPRCTFMVPLLENPDEQLAAFPKDARYSVRRARRDGIEAYASTTSVTQDLEEFLDLLEETAGRQKFALRPREYYRQFVRDLPATLVCARSGSDGPLLVGAIILVFGDEAHYLHGASGRGENPYASYLVQFEAMCAARRAGAKWYDMGGIPCAPHEEDPLWGVYKFKKKFGGEERRFVGAYEKNLDPARSRLARAGLRGYYALQKLRGKSAGPISD